MPDKPPAPQRVDEASAPAPFIYFDIVAAPAVGWAFLRSALSACG